MTGERTQTLRQVVCALRERDFCARSRGGRDGCDDAEVTRFLRELLERHEAAAEAFEEEGRPAMADREREEAMVIAEFLPRPLSADELGAAVRQVVEELDARKLTDMGRCMDVLKSRYAGQISPAEAQKAVRAALR